MRISITDYRTIDEPLARIEPGGTIRYYLADALGSIIALVDDNEVVKTRYNYSPFGVTEIAGEASDNPFMYTARELDETGHYYYRARYYDPEMGRFISEDPIGFAGGDVNFYRYVGNRPVNLVDPVGLYKMSDTAGGPLDSRTDAALKCFENCLGWEVTVTGARECESPHVPGSAHCDGQACDLGKNSNPDLKRPDVERCFSECSGSNGFDWGYEGVPNFHFQTRPNIWGAKGFRQGTMK